MSRFIAPVLTIAVLGLVAAIFLLQARHRDLLQAEIAHLTADTAVLVRGQRDIQAELAGFRRSLARQEALERSAVTPPLEASVRAPIDAAAGLRFSPQSRVPVPIRLAPGIGSVSPAILINGRRLVVDGKPVDEADMKDFPMSTIERVEVLPPQAGTPGAPAVNVVLKAEPPHEPVK